MTTKKPKLTPEQTMQLENDYANAWLENKRQASDLSYLIKDIQLIMILSFIAFFTTFSIVYSLTR